MTKTFKFHNANMSIEATHSYGQYILSGLGIKLHTTDSEIYDYCDDEEENPKKCKEVKRVAYKKLKSQKFYEKSFCC